ncbi:MULTISPECIES: type II toxin-antitoxin system RelE/ParE family toxin [Micromonospora]|uniref:type II toxin-antitoxin system RelE/ParE family toxin n=1 Tax=Micromonospora TaxID=1873 RepID=UPI001EE96361|nr:type II toxin-antitoxin system RelE/ParE family toxin [Micromonospora hortensis]MCG5449910.1 type II toxin-antitoxin system RelE/ParE family toxin [Micromonospora hortensis]WTI09047.1 type II toxin-antitoxin system RelE/ParE family toxin [Micromonospora sp. NBC_00821]
MWDVKLHPEVEEWFLNLCKTDPASADLISEAIDLLAEHGPALGRPLVDRLKGSIFHHMKELRPGSTGSTEVRMIFAFDPVREAVFWLLATSRASGRLGTRRRSRWRTTGFRSTSPG